MESLFQDVRYAARLLARQPGFTLVAVLTLALGIGANTAVFSLTNAVLLRSLPVAQPEQLVRLHGAARDGSRHQTISYSNYADYRDRNQVFSGLAATSVAAAIMPGRETEQLLGEIVSGNYFEVLAVPAVLGRAFLSEEDKLGGRRVIVISDGLWQRRFGSDPHVLGQTITLNGDTFTVVGVAPRRFSGTFAGLVSQFWIPAQAAERWQGVDWLRNRETRRLHLLGRLKPGVSRTQAEAALTTLARQIQQDHPETTLDHTIEVVPATLLHGNLRRGASLFLAAMMLLAGLVLLTACANLANLFLVRGLGRRRAIAIRLALGATRGRIARQFLAESLLVAFLGAAVGLVLSLWATEAISRFNPIPSVPLRFDFSPDVRVFAFLFTAALLTGILIGLVPVLRSSPQQITPELKSESGTVSGGRSKAHLRSAFVIAQVTLCLVSLIAAGLFLRSLQQAQAFNLGFNPDHALALDVDLAPLGYAEQEGRQLYHVALQRLAALPGVEGVALAERAPPDISMPEIPVSIEGQQPPPGQSALPLSAQIISPDYFSVMRIPLLRGRQFTEQDRSESPGVAIVNETMARRFWPAEDAVGRSFSLAPQSGTASTPAAVTIVGVVANSKYRTIGEDSTSHLYLPFAQHYQPGMTLLARTAADPAVLIGSIQRELQAVDPKVQGFFARTLIQHLGLSLLPARLAAALSGAFGLLALLLASTGLYGVISYVVAQRTREIGIRMALGAQRGDILKLVLGQGMALTLVGVAIGLAAAFALARLLTSMLYGVPPTDPVTFVVVTALVIVVALLACWIPARRATRVEPLVALRYE